MRALKKILVPVDFSGPSTEAFDDALELARSYGAEVIALHVWEPPRVLGPETTFYAPQTTMESAVKLIADHAQERTEAFVAAHEAPASEVRVSARVEAGLPYVVILDVAEQEDVDLIVMGTHGRSGLVRFFLGSVTEKVIRHAPCPVLTIRAKRSAAPRAEGPARTAP